jgi:GT2 family glycosyltransferase
VVDNGSTDESLQILKERTWVKTVRASENLGFAGGNNLGLGHCRGRYILLLNNDTITISDFLTPLTDYLDKHPKVGAVQGKMVLPRQGNSLDVCGSFLTSIGLPYHYGNLKPDGPKYQRSYPVFSGKGACLIFRRELIEKVGGFLFDDTFKSYYEESDFCHRVWLAGYEVHFVPSPPIEHLQGATGGRLLKEATVQHQYVRNMMFSLLGNLSAPSIARIMPGFCFVLALRMVSLLFRFKLRAFVAHWTAFTYNVRNPGKIKARRQLVKQIRKTTDGEIFAKVLKNPNWRYFYKTLQEKIGEYVDEEFESPLSS